LPAHTVDGFRPRRRPPHSLLRPFRAVLFGAAMLTTIGCFDQMAFPDTESDGRVTVSNDDQALASRVRYLDKDIELEPPNPAAFASMVSGPALNPTGLVSAYPPVTARSHFPSQTLAPVDLGTAIDFVILSKSGITNVPTSAITGNIGTSPITGAAITGLDCAEVTGNVYTVDAAGPACRTVDASGLSAAVLDMGAAYGDAAGRTNPDHSELGGGSIGGLTLTPGLYKWSGAVTIPTDATLAGTNSARDVWIFQIAGDLTQAGATSVILSGGAQAKNVFWQVAGVARFGAGAHFEGIVLGATGIAPVTGATFNGRLFAQTSVTLQKNTVTEPGGGEMRIILNAELDPPTVNGQLLQATSTSRRKNGTFLVSYNVRGGSFLGAVDYLTEADGQLPRVSSSVLFTDSDVSAAAFGLDGLAIYAAQATDAAGFATPASLERMILDEDRIQLQDGSRIDLSSFAATSVQEIGNYIYVTTGDDGGVFALDPSDLSIVGQFALDDARWVDHDTENDRVVVVQGTPGRISVFEEGSFPGGSMNLLNTFDFDGATIPESKSAMDIAGGKAFIAAGPQGVQVMCLDNGAIVGSVPRPDPGALGLSDDVVVTNAVTVDKDLMFISNGEAGVYVAAGDEEWKDTACDETQAINILGRLRFDDLQSVNHVGYRDGHLFIAAGTGGVKIVEIWTR
jgi:hypothetical protein